jgi:hypothetical protein
VLFFGQFSDRTQNIYIPEIIRPRELNVVSAEIKLLSSNVPLSYRITNGKQQKAP